MDKAVAGLQEFRTPCGLVIRRTAERLDPGTAVESVIDDLDSHPGVLLASNYEYPGRYTRWSRGFSRPVLAIHGRGRDLRIEALTERGEVVLLAVADVLAAEPAIDVQQQEARLISCVARVADGHFAEEDRSKQPSVFSALRALTTAFALTDEPYLGFYGAFGYDLVFQFESIAQHQERSTTQRDLVLYLPDELIEVDHGRGEAHRLRYEFAYRGRATDGLSGDCVAVPYQPSDSVPRQRDHEPGEFADTVAVAKDAFRRGDLFEVVPGQTFFAPSPSPPSAVYRRLREANPAPFGGLLSLGDQEYLVSGSPEMYVRVEGDRVESCPISGTIRRGGDVFGDERMIRELLNSSKDEAELTMCTDVDRNDKSRVCRPGSVRVIGRRQIEVYSKVIHTVDHIEGRLREGYDAIDAFLTHMWAVTVTGAPKLWAMRFIEQHERSARRWYGGAIGYLGFDGNMMTGLTLRTVRIADGVAEVRAGGTLLIDSDPAEEERESELKAAAFLEALRAPTGLAASAQVSGAPGRSAEVQAGADATDDVAGSARVLLLDCEDSFVHTLANYVRQGGADVRTIRAPLAPVDLQQHIDAYRPTVILLSPGPGRPEDFGVSKAVEVALAAGIAVWGVCLGLQGIVEHFGGQLGLLDYPMHGKPSEITVVGGELFRNLPPAFEAGRYHSLHAPADSLPDELAVTAVTADGVVMAVEHRTLPVAAVQFHPESIMSAHGEVGLQLVRDTISRLSARACPTS